MTLLSLSNIGVSFGATELFKDVSFTVAEGERWGIIGRNGAGKSSIFDLIIGDLQPTVGSEDRIFNRGGRSTGPGPLPRAHR